MSQNPCDCDACQGECDDDFDAGDEGDNTTYTPPPAATVHALAHEPTWDKSQYLMFAGALNGAHEQSVALFGQVIEKVRRFDPEFARRLQAIQDAEKAALDYCNAKLESAGPVAQLGR